MVTSDHIINKTSGLEDYQIIEPMVKVEASVAIPLIDSEDGAHILFEKRNMDIPQGGEICFPGGIIEGLETPKETAIREIKEELILSDDQVEFIDTLHVMGTEYGTKIYSNLVRIIDYKNTFSESEVDSVFTVPVKWFKENRPEIYDVHLVRDKRDKLPYEIIPGGKDYPWKSLKSKLYFYRSSPEIIWGLTAKLLYYFIENI